MKIELDHEALTMVWEWLNASEIDSQAPNPTFLSFSVLHSSAGPWVRQTPRLVFLQDLQSRAAAGQARSDSEVSTVEPMF